MGNIASSFGAGFGIGGAGLGGGASAGVASNVNINSGLGLGLGLGLGFGVSGGASGSGSGAGSGQPNHPASPIDTSSRVNPTPVSNPSINNTPDKTPFYLKSSCDNFCVGMYGGDGQTYSNAYTQTGKTFDLFYFMNGQLIDNTATRFCVASESGGTQTQFQCSGDLDGAGTDQFSQTNGLLDYQGNTAFYGCGTSSTTDASSTGLTYSRVLGNANQCRQCTFSIVTDVNQCGTATPPPTVIVPPSPPTTCASGKCSVMWNGAQGCYQTCNIFDSKSCKSCPGGTKCQATSKSSWACLPPKSFY